VSKTRACPPPAAAAAAVTAAASAAAATAPAEEATPNPPPSLAELPTLFPLLPCVSASSCSFLVF